MSPLEGWLEDLLEGCSHPQRKTNTVACIAFKEVVDVSIQTQRKLDNSQKTLKRDLKRDILSPISLVFFLLY